MTRASRAKSEGPHATDTVEPRYWRMLGYDAPSWHDIVGDADAAVEKDWPLHVKNVTPINTSEVLLLPCKHPETKEYFRHAVRWLSDPSLYNADACGKPNIRRTLYTDAQIQTMMEVKIKQYPEARLGPPLSGLFGFPRAECHKKRHRPIFAPDTNRTLLSETLQPMHYRTRADVRRAVHNGEYCVQVDMKSYYDQFLLDESVRRFFVFKHAGRLYSLRTLAMGQRQACEIAQACTWLLVDFEMDESIHVTTCIDNIRFVGPRHHVVTAVRGFLKRCKQVGAQLNEVDVNATDVETLDVDTLAEKSGVFLGEHYDYIRKTVKVSEKTIEKLRICNERLTTQCATERRPMPVRHLASHVALLFYTAQTLGLHLAKYYGALRYYRDLSALLANDITMWNARDIPPIPPGALKELLAWTHETLQNVPRRIPTADEDEASPTLTITTDASQWGWAAATIDHASGTAHTYQQAWGTDEIGRMGESAAAEPEAVWRAVCRAVRPQDKVVEILTDHQPLVFPSAKGYAKGWNPNLLMLRLHAAFPSTRFIITHIAGVDNPSDEASRGGTWNWAAIQKAMQLAAAEQREERRKIAQGADQREGEAELAPAYNKRQRMREFMI